MKKNLSYILGMLLALSPCWASDGIPDDTTGAAAAASAVEDPFAHESAQVQWAHKVLELVRCALLDESLPLVDKQAFVRRPIRKPIDSAAMPESLSAVWWDSIEAAKGHSDDALQTNVVALCICLGDRDLFAQILDYIEDVNSPAYFSWGYRQKFSLAHVALSPFFPYCHHVSIGSRLSIIDLLGSRGVDFNLMIRDDIYNNPPLSCARGMCHGWADVTDALRVRALMWGADPRIVGTYGPAFPNNYDRRACYRDFVDCLSSGEDIPDGTISTPVLAHILTTLARAEED